MAKTKKQLPWRSSWKTMKSAIEFCAENGWNILLLIFWQVVLAIVLVWLNKLVLESGASELWRDIFEIASTAIYFLYQLYIASMVTVLYRDGDQVSLLEISRKEVLPKFHRVVLVTIIYVALTALGISLILIPGIYLLCAWFVVLPALLLENDSVMDAFKRSYRLSKGYIWPLLSRLTTSFFVIMVIRSFRVVPEAGLLFSGILGLFITPVIVAYVVETYIDLSEVKTKSKESKSGWSVGKKFATVLWTIFTLLLFAVVTPLADFVQEATIGGFGL